MSGINGIFSAEQQQQHQQSNTYSVITTDVLSFSIGNISDNNLINITNRNENDSTSFTSLTYTIIFGLVCACLCFLTITGNLLVLITFRRMRTVSINKIYISQMND